MLVNWARLRPFEAYREAAPGQISRWVHSASPFCPISVLNPSRYDGIPLVFPRVAPNTWIETLLTSGTDSASVASRLSEHVEG